MTKSPRLTRRRVVELGLGTFAGASALSLLRQTNDKSQQMAALDNNDPDLLAAGDTPLKQRAIAKKLIYGGASGYKELTSDQSFADIFPQECMVLMVGEDLMWRNVHPQLETFSFTKADWLADFARKHKMLFGSGLVWHGFLPEWFKEKVNKQNAKQVLQEHIEKVAGHFAGKVHLWHVVNEAILPKDGRADGLRNTQFLEALGADFIEMSFRAASQADPNALLFYNDYGLEYDVPDQEAKRTAILKLLERLKSSETPIHGLGIQSHIGYNLDLKHNQLKTFMRNVADLGLQILISEVDVIDKNFPQNIPTRDRIVAGVYKDFLDVVLAEPAVMGIITWGLSDRYTWHTWNEPRKDGAPVRPLPLDANLKRKLAWHVIARAFDTTAVRQNSTLWTAWSKL